MAAKVRFKGVAAYLPAHVVSNQELEEAGFDLASSSDNFFKGVNRRHWASPMETSVFMGAQAARRLLDEQNLAPERVDLIICSAIIGDALLPHPASGIQFEIGAMRAAAITLDTGCASFVSGVIYGSALIRSGMFRNVLVISISNFAGRAQRKSGDASAFVPGDGAGAALLCGSDEGEDGFLGSWEKSFGQYHRMLSIQAIDENGVPAALWEPHQKLAFWFDRQLTEVIKTNGRKLVPLAINGALREAGLDIAEVSVCFTHQPNEFLLRQWRSDLRLKEEQHHHTLAACGNLFQASIPVSMVSAIRAGKLKAGDTIAMGSFALAGEIAAGTVLRMA